MKLWSRGLGRSELTMDFRKYVIRKNSDGGGASIFGKITDPVHWEFKITFEPEDVPGLIRVALNKHMLIMIVKNVYKYAVYLMKRKQFQDEEFATMEEKVEKAYENMVARSKRLSVL